MIKGLLKMITTLFTLLWLSASTISAVPATSVSTIDDSTALLIIDIQDFYFPGAERPLVEPEKASVNTQKILAAFREKKGLVIHVKHKSEKLSDIHKSVKPIEGEQVFEKTEVNCFTLKPLQEYLQNKHVKRIVFCGMQTHMCLEGAVRAAKDLGYDCTVIHDACATKDVVFGGKKVPAEQVHCATLGTLESGGYAKVLDTKTYLSK